MNVTDRAKETWQDAKIKAADAGQAARDFNRKWKLSERYADVVDRLKHAEYKAASVASGEFRRRFEMSMAYHAAHPDQIEQRLRELDEEWSAEDVFQATLLGVGALGALMSKTRGRLWGALPLAVGFMQFKGIGHQKPPGLAFFRRAGFRTNDEIKQEKYALKALRGDFAELEQQGGGADHVAKTDTPDEDRD
ncbi:MAG: hypothetical protein AAGD32_10815 [Planctomycetota bacterium]